MAATPNRGPLCVCLPGRPVAEAELGCEVRNASVLVAIGVDAEGFRDVLGVSEGSQEDKASWTALLREWKERGLTGVQLFVSDKCLGLVENLGDFHPEARCQCCAVHFYRNGWTKVPSGAELLRFSPRTLA